MNIEMSTDMSPERAPRIASLVPSLTELVVELGLGSRLVARTGFCIHPAEAVRRVTKIGGTKDVNLARLERPAPTHVLVNVDENRLDTIEAIRRWPLATRPQVVVTHPLTPEDNLVLVDQMADAFGSEPGVSARASVLRSMLDAELALTRATTQRVPRRVLYLIWRDPWMTVARDTYLSRMLGLIGWRTWPDVDGGERGASRYPRLDGREGWLTEVDLVLLSSEPYRFDDAHVAEAQALCPSATVRRVDGELLSWYGARAVPGLRYLRELADRDAAGAGVSTTH